MRNYFTKKRLFFLGVTLLAVLSLSTLVLFSGRSVQFSILQEAAIIFSHDNAAYDAEMRDPHPLLGVSCEYPKRRPFAVMLAGDHVARPLSGIAHADLVIEMPVVTGSITRYMALFACNTPEEIGSIRSARDDFIPLAAAFDAVYVHWGGSHFALDQLRKDIIENIDALQNPFNAFFRKSGIPRPHNGFTSMERLAQSSRELGYRSETEFRGYPRAPEPWKNGKTGTLTIGYPSRYQVRWEYNPETAQYLRWRGGEAETDALDGRQVQARSIVIMETTSRQIEGQYNDVLVVGRGPARIFHSGKEQKGFWEKAPEELKAPLFFKDARENEIALAPGTIWIEIVDQVTPVVWETPSRQTPQ